jgi:outer membrane protein TolC
LPFAAAACALAACVSYAPAPVDVSRVLASLEAIRWDPSLKPDSGEGARPRQLAAFAVAHNPTLRAARAQIGVAEAVLVEAGLLDDPELGWDGMDALAARIVTGTTSSVDFVAGFGLMVPLPRPGERDAAQGAARWRVAETRQRVAHAEWMLARETFVACEDALEAELLLAQNQELVDVAEATDAHFERALGAGAATAIQANLAKGDVLAIRAQRFHLEARVRDARQRLNALLGLPPGTVVPLSAAGADAGDEAPGDPLELAERALLLRPDLAALRAAYQAAEDDVRLAIARQFPPLAIGTGISLVPGLFTRFHRPAIATAEARRAALAGEIEAQVHEVRGAVFDAHAALAEAAREVGFLEARLLPNAEDSLRLARQAFDAGEVTLLEILTLQRALVDARTRTTEARAELRRSRWRLGFACGSPDLLPQPIDDESEASK